MQKKFIAFVCVLALLCALLPSALGVDTMYFTAVNDRMLDYSADTMPVISRGTVYVPYTVFLQSTNGGVDLGVFGSQNRPLNTLSLYGKQKMVLTFDIGAGTAYDMMDNTYTPAIVRNGIIFVPAWTVCNYFELQYSYLPNGYGALIRIKRQDGYYLDDRFFVSSAEDKFRSQKREFDRDQGKDSPASPSPTPSASPSPTPGVQGPDYSKTRVSFAFRINGGQGPDSLADSLERYGQRGLFFFPADALSQWDDQIRRLVAQGHKVGVLVDGEDAAACLAQAQQANRLLGHIARTKTDFLLVDNSALRAELAGQGWVCWQGTINAVPGAGARAASHAAALRQQLETGRTVARLTMDDSEVSAGTLERLLPRLQSDGYTFQPITEAAL